jgi:hypothetical protein
METVLLLWDASAAGGLGCLPLIALLTTPQEFCEEWPGYTNLFDGLVTWSAEE